MVLAACTSERKTLEERIFELAADEDGLTAQEAKAVAGEGYGVDEKGLQVVVAELQDSAIDKTEKTVFIEMLHTTEGNFRKVFGENGTKVAKKRIDLFGGKLDPFWFWQKNPTIEQARGYLAKLDQMGDQEDQLVMLKNFTVKGEVKKLVDEQIKSVLRSIQQEWRNGKSPHLIGRAAFRVLKKLLMDETQDGETRSLVLECLTAASKEYFTPIQALEMLDYLCPSVGNDGNLIKLLDALKTLKLWLGGYLDAIHAMFSLVDEKAQPSREKNYMRALRKMPFYATTSSDILSVNSSLAGHVEKLKKEDLEAEKNYYLTLFQTSNDKRVKLVAVDIYMGLCLSEDGHLPIPELLALKDKTKPADEDILIQANYVSLSYFGKDLADNAFLRRFEFFNITETYGVYDTDPIARDDWDGWQEVAGAHPTEKTTRYLLAMRYTSRDVKTALADLHEMMATPLDYEVIPSDYPNSADIQRRAGIRVMWSILRNQPDYEGMEDEIRYLRQWITYASEGVLETATNEYIAGVKGNEAKYKLPSDEAQSLGEKAIPVGVGKITIGGWTAWQYSFVHLQAAGLISDCDVERVVAKALDNPWPELGFLACMLARVHVSPDLAKKAVAKLKERKYNFSWHFRDNEPTAKEMIKAKQGLTDADF